MSDTSILSLHPELLQALLSLDSYNRGYNPQIALPGGANGNEPIATATFVAQSAIETDGFYAICYSVGGQDIISYRGTDNAGVESLTGSGGSDIYNGWVIGAGYLAFPSDRRGGVL